MKFKKILSLLLCVIMVSSCLTPAIVTAIGCSISVDSIEVVEGTTTAVPAISISGNPGFSYAKFAVVYKSAELSQTEEVTSDLFDYVSTSNIRSTQLANYLPEGVDKSEYKGFFIEVEDEDFVNVYDDGNFVCIPFDLVSSEAGSTYTYYVSAVEAFNENDEEVVIDGSLVEGNITVLKDENLGKYDEFTMFMAPEAITVEAGETVNVDLRLDANPGLWSIRCMIVFPEELYVETDGAGNALVDNGTVFQDKAMNVGIANLPLTDSRLLVQYQQYFEKEGIETEGYKSLVFYYEPDDPSMVITGNGVLASIPFNTDNAVPGKSYEIKIYYVNGDIFRAEGGTTFVDLFPATVGATVNIAGEFVCPHANTSNNTVRATCTEDGYKETVCDDCDSQISYEVLLAPGHNYLQPGSTVIVPPTCTEGGWTEKTCQVCGDTAYMDETEPEGHWFVDGYCEYCGEYEATFNCGIYADWVTVMEGNTSAHSNIYLYNNPGIAYIKLAVVYKVSELEMSNEDPCSWMLDTVSVSNIRAKDLAAYIPEDADASEYKGMYITLESSSFENIYDDGDLVSIPFELVDPQFGDVYNYYVSVVEACDEYENTVTVEGCLISGAVEYCKDENLGKYDDFTMFFTPEYSELELGAGGFDMDLRVDANPGLWSIRCYVVYPEELTLEAVENGNVFPRDADLNVGIYNLPLDSDRQVSAFKNLIKSEGIETEGYHSTTLYFEPESPDSLIDASGILASLSFSINSNAEAGDVYDIKVYYATGDIFRAEGGTTFTDLFPATVGAEINIASGYVCPHSSYWTEEADATCTEDGYVQVICSDCGEEISYAVIEAYGHYYEDGTCLVCGYTIPAGDFTMFFDPDYVEVWDKSESVSVDIDIANNPGIWGTRFYVVYPEELSLEGYTNGGVYTSDCMNVGTVDLPLSSDLQVPAFKDLIAEQGIKTEGYHSTTFYFEPISIYDTIFNNGTLVTLDFAVSESSRGGESYEIFIYYATGDIFSADADSLTFTDYFPVTHTCTVSVYDYSCSHSETTVETVNATCTDDGYTSVICLECDTVISTYLIPATGHSYVDGSCEHCGKLDYSAIDGIYAERVEVLEGATTASTSILVNNNPGFLYGKFAVVYKTAELVPGEATSALFETISISNIRNNQLANYVPEGEDASEYKGFFVEIENSDDVAAESAVFTLAFDLAAPAVGDTYTFYVSAVEAFNANDDEVSLGDEFVAGSISVIKDENLGKYDEFTMFFAPEALTVEAGEKAVVDLRVDANPGLWSIRCMIVFPEELAVETDGSGAALVENGNVFADPDLNVGIANLPLTSDKVLIKYQKYFADNGIETEGYNSLVLYYAPEDPAAVITNNGILASIPFNTDNAVAGETYEIKVYYVTGDIFRAEGGTNFTDLFPETAGATVICSCEHNDTIYEIQEPTCISDGYEGIVCADCGEHISVTVLPATSDAHELVHIDAVEAGCHYIGNIEYWYCTVCEIVWQDAALTQLTNFKNVILPALGTDNLIHIDAVAPTCATLGNIEYWYCPDCEQFWQNETLTQLTNSKNVVVGTLDHNIVCIDAVEAGCHYNGNIEYWYCVDCNAVWADEALTQLTNSKNVILPALGSDNLVHVEATEPGCVSNGNIEYWYCPDCEHFWQDAALTQLTNSKNVILPSLGGHAPGASEVIAATCTQNGSVTIRCRECGEIISRDVIYATGHSEMILPAVAPTCSQYGFSEGKMCITCGETLVAQTYVDKVPHTLSLDQYIPSTCTVNGALINKCIHCSYSLTEKLPLEAHVFENGYCINCQAADNDAKIVVSDAKTAAGKTFNVTVDLKNNPGIVSMCLKVNYDSDSLVLVGVEDAGVLGTTAHKPEYKSPYTLTWVNDTATENYTVNGTIVTLTFEVLDNAAYGDYEISVTYDNRDFDIFDKDLNTVDFEIVSGTVSVVEYIVGDVNGDGVVNKLDRVILTRYLADWNDYQDIDLLAADVNEDGEVNNLDRVILTRYLAEWEEYPSLPHVN